MPNREHLFGRLHDAVRTAQRFLLVAHKKPDGDTLGASSSFLNWLIREGKTVTAFCLDQPSAAFRFIDNIHRYTSDPAVFDKEYDLVIVFDSGSLQYCGVADHLPRLKPGYLFVNIDHHATNERYGHLNLVFTEASSTAEVVHRFFEANNIPPDARIATSLLTGLFTDTGNFTNSGTTAFSLEAASRLIAAGARHTDILKHIWSVKNIDLLKLWGKVLSRLQYNARLDLAATYILKEDVLDLPSDITDGISNFLSAVVGQAETILVLKELPTGEVQGSLRSHKRNVSKVAGLLGGGGHKKAAGFTIRGKIEVTPRGPKVVSA